MTKFVHVVLLLAALVLTSTASVPSALQFLEDLNVSTVDYSGQNTSEPTKFNWNFPQVFADNASAVETTNFSSRTCYWIQISTSNAIRPDVFISVDNKLVIDGRTWNDVRIIYPGTVTASIDNDTTNVMSFYVPFIGVPYSVDVDVDGYSKSVLVGNVLSAQLYAWTPTLLYNLSQMVTSGVTYGEAVNSQVTSSQIVVWFKQGDEGDGTNNVFNVDSHRVVGSIYVAVENTFNVSGVVTVHYQSKSLQGDVFNAAQEVNFANISVSGFEISFNTLFDILDGIVNVTQVTIPVVWTGGSPGNVRVAQVQLGRIPVVFVSQGVLTPRGPTLLTIVLGVVLGIVGIGVIAGIVYIWRRRQGKQTPTKPLLK